MHVVLIFPLLVLNQLSNRLYYPTIHIHKQDDRDCIKQGCNLSQLYLTPKQLRQPTGHLHKLHQALREFFFLKCYPSKGPLKTCRIWVNLIILCDENGTTLTLYSVWTELGNYELYLKRGHKFDKELAEASWKWMTVRGVWV